MLPACALLMKKTFPPKHVSDPAATLAFSLLFSMSTCAQCTTPAQNMASIFPLSRCKVDAAVGAATRAAPCQLSARTKHGMVDLAVIALQNNAAVGRECAACHAVVKAVMKRKCYFHSG